MAEAWITAAAASAPAALQAPLRELGDLAGRKLYKQLTDNLIDLLKEPANAAQLSYNDLYENFVAKFEAKLNQVKLAVIAAYVAKAIATTGGDAAGARAFLEALAGKRERLGPEAALYVDMELALLKIKQGDLTDVEASLKGGKAVLDGLAGAEAIVYSNYYKAALEYHKVVGPPHAFYKAALSFLAYTPVETLSEEEKYNLAVDLSLAALTGDGVFNFGEVLATPLLAVLQQTPHAWLSDLLTVFDHGDVDAFAALVDRHRDAYFAQPALANRQEFVKEKVVLLSLMNLVFATPAHERTLPFTAIAEKGRIGVEQVEWLLMRAMSLGLIKGVIDEVDQTVNVAWVQPRVLSQPQIATLATRLEGWAQKVQETLVYVEEQTPELFN